LNEGKVFTEVTDEGSAFQTVGAVRNKAKQRIFTTHISKPLMRA